MLTSEVPRVDDVAAEEPSKADANGDGGRKDAALTHRELCRAKDKSYAAAPRRGGADTDGSAEHTDRPQSAAEAEGGCGPLQPGSRVDAAGRYCDVLLRGCCSRESVGDEKRLGGRPVPSGAEVPTSSTRVGSVQNQEGGGRRPESDDRNQNAALAAAPRWERVDQAPRQA